MTGQEQGSPASPQVFSSIPAPSSTGHDEFHQALKDPEFAKAVRGLDPCLTVRERLQDDGGMAGVRSGSSSVPSTSVRLPGLLLRDKPPVSAGGGVGCGNGNESLLEGHVSDFSGNFVNAAAHETSGQSKRIAGLLEVRQPGFPKKVGAAAAHAIAGENKGIVELLEVNESDFSKKAGGAVAAATAGESDKNLALRSSVESHSRHNSPRGADVAASARVSAVPAGSATASSSASAPASLAVVAHALHAHACAVNSWSDTGRLQGPTGRRSPKVGFPVRPKICTLSQRWRQG